MASLLFRYLTKTPSQSVGVSFLSYCFTVDILKVGIALVKIHVIFHSSSFIVFLEHQRYYVLRFLSPLNDLFPMHVKLTSKT